MNLHKIKKIVIDLVLLLLPLAYIAYILYIRLFLIRAPRILYIKMSYISIFFALLIIFSLILRIYYILQKLSVFKKRESDNKIILQIQKPFISFAHYTQTIWRMFYNRYITNYLRVNQIILKFIIVLDQYMTTKLAGILLVVFEILPKTILVLTFLFDIFIQQQLYYFYKMLFLLLLPLIFSLLITLLKTFYYDNYPALDSYVLKSTFVNNSGETEILYSYADDFEPPAYVKDLKDFLENLYFPVQGIPDILVYFEIVKIKYKLDWLFLFILILHLLGWLIILFFGIYL